MLDMVKNFGVNMFKVDGVSFGESNGPGTTAYADQVESLIGLLKRLRHLSKKDLWINLTTGMWPSPYWLMYGDSIWRGFRDLGIHGEGSLRQQWVTFRDAVVHKFVVSRAALFPMSSLMLHGIVAGKVRPVATHSLAPHRLTLLGQRGPAATQPAEQNSSHPPTGLCWSQQVGESRALRLDTISFPEFADEVWSYFSMGVQLQEL